MPEYVTPDFAKMEGRDPKSRTRVTFILPDAVNFDLDIYATFFSMERQEIVREAVYEYLRSRGVSNPEVYPTIQWKVPESST